MAQIRLGGFEPQAEDKPRRRGRAKGTKNGGGNGGSGANLGFEAMLFRAADKLRNNLDAAEYKHVVLGLIFLIFLKYISDAFEERRQWLLKEMADPSSDYYVREEPARYGVAEDRDEYLAENIFWVPEEARWPYLQARQATNDRQGDRRCDGRHRAG